MSFFDKITMDVSEQRNEIMFKRRNKIINIIVTLTVVMLLYSTAGLISYAVEDETDYSVSAYATDSDFEKSIAAFPDEYKPYLRELHEKYPQWTFIPFETQF